MLHIFTPETLLCGGDECIPQMCRSNSALPTAAGQYTVKKLGVINCINKNEH